MSDEMESGGGRRGRRSSILKPAQAEFSCAFDEETTAQQPRQPRRVSFANQRQCAHFEEDRIHPPTEQRAFETSNESTPSRTATQMNPFNATPDESHPENVSMTEQGSMEMSMELTTSFLQPPSSAGSCTTPTPASETTLASNHQTAHFLSHLYASPTSVKSPDDDDMDCTGESEAPAPEEEEKEKEAEKSLVEEQEPEHEEEEEEEEVVMRVEEEVEEEEEEAKEPAEKLLHMEEEVSQVVDTLKPALVSASSTPPGTPVAATPTPTARRRSMVLYLEETLGVETDSPRNRLSSTAFPGSIPFHDFTNLSDFSTISPPTKAKPAVPTTPSTSAVELRESPTPSPSPRETSAAGSTLVQSGVVVDGEPEEWDEFLRAALLDPQLYTAPSPIATDESQKEVAMNLEGFQHSIIISSIQNLRDSNEAREGELRDLCETTSDHIARLIRGRPSGETERNRLRVAALNAALQLVEFMAAGLDNLNRAFENHYRSTLVDADIRQRRVENLRTKEAKLRAELESLGTEAERSALLDGTALARATAAVGAIKAKEEDGKLLRSLRSEERSLELERLEALRTLRTKEKEASLARRARISQELSRVFQNDSLS